MIYVEFAAVRFFKLVKWMHYSSPRKSTKPYHIMRVFSDMSTITPEILIHHSVKATYTRWSFYVQLTVRLNFCCFARLRCLFVRMAVSDQDIVCWCFYAQYACPKPRRSYTCITGVIMDIGHTFFQLSNDRMWLILSEVVGYLVIVS